MSGTAQQIDGRRREDDAVRIHQVIDVEYATRGKAERPAGGQRAVDVQLVAGRKRHAAAEEDAAALIVEIAGQRRDIDRAGPAVGAERAGGIQRKVTAAMGERDAAVGRGAVVEFDEAGLDAAGVGYLDAAAAAVGNIRVNGSNAVGIGANRPGRRDIHAAVCGVEPADVDVLVGECLSALAGVVVTGVDHDRCRAIDGYRPQQVHVPGRVGVETVISVDMQLAARLLADVAQTVVGRSAVGNDFDMPAIDDAARAKADVAAVSALRVGIA